MPAGLVYPITVQDRASAAFEKIAGATNSAAEAAAKYDEAAAGMTKYQQRAAQSAIKAAAAIEDVSKAMAETAGQSKAVQKATLGVVAAQDRLATAMESGRASAASLADAQASLIGAEERLAVAQRGATASTIANTAAQGEAKAASAGLLGSFGGLAKMAGELGLVIGGIEIGKKAIEFISAGKELTTSLNSVQAASQATDKQMQAVRATTLAIGKDMSIPASSAVDAANAIDDLVRAGVKLPRAMVAARPALLLATASQTDMALSARVLGDTLDEYQLPASKAAHVSDVLAAASSHAAGGLETVFDAMRYVAPQAHVLHIPLTDLTGAIDDLVKSGFQGTTVGTGLAMAFQRLAARTPQSTAALKDLGVTAFDAQGRFKGIANLVEQLSAAQKRFGPNSEQFLADISRAFGARASKVIAAFASRGVEGLNQMTAVMRNGDVQKAADEMNRGVSADLAQINKQFTATGIAIYQGVEPKLESLLHAFQVGLPQAVDIVKNAMAPFVAAFKVAADVLGPIASAIGSLASHARFLGPVLKIAASGALSLYAAMKLLAGVRAVGVLLSTALAKTGQAALTSSIRVTTLGRSIRGLRTGETAVSGGGLATALVAVGVGAYAAGKGISSLVEKNNSFANTLQNISKISSDYQTALNASNGALDDGVRQTVALSLQTDGLAAKAQKAGISLGQLTAGVTGSGKDMLTTLNALSSAGVINKGDVYSLIQLRGAYEDDAKAGKNFGTVGKDTAAVHSAAAGAAGKQASAELAAARAQAAAAAQAKALDTALQNLAQTQLGAAQSEDQFREGILSLTQTIKSNHDQLNKNTQAGLANRDALLNMLGSAVSLANAQRKNGASIDSVTTSLQGNVRQLIQTAVNAGLSRNKVEALVRQMGLTPKDIATKFHLDGTTTALTQLRNVRTQLDIIGRGVDATVRIHTVGTAPNGTTVSTTRGVSYNAAGGYISGPGTSTSDSIPARLSNGEFVINAKATSKHMGLLHAINAGAQGFATGGAVGNKRAIAALLASMGATKAGIAGFLGNTQVESGFKTTAYNPGENAHGFQQWEGGRLTLLQSIANKMGKSITSQAVQLRMIHHELTHGYGDTLNVLRHATSARAAAAYVDAHYERSSGDARTQRENDAQRIYRHGVPTSSQGGSGRSAPSKGRAAPVAAPPLTKIPPDHFKLVMPAATAFAKAAARTVIGLVARSVRPADTSVSGLAGQVRYQGLRATNLTQASMKARNVYAQEAGHVASVSKQLVALQAEEKREKTSATASGKAAVAAMQKRLTAAKAAASAAKDAWDKASGAAKSAQQAAESAAKALVDSLQSQADALVSAVQGFQSTISQGLTQGTDLASLWNQVTSAQSDATDQLTTANQNLADAQQAVADAQDAITKAQPDTSSLLAAQNAAAQAQAQFTQAHSTLLAAQAAVAAGAGTPAQYAALTAAQQRQSDTLTALAAANSDLASAQQAVSQATGPTTDDIQALATAQQNLATATTAAATAASNAASNTGSYANLQAAFDATLKSTQNFAADLSKLTAEGAGQDLVSQIAAMGAASGDALAQQLLAAGPDGIKALQASMTAIQNVAGKEADVLSKGFYSAGANSLMQLVAGMEKQFPALKAALAPIVAQLQAMFTFTPIVVDPGGSSTTSSSGSATKVITVAKATTLGALAAAQGVKLDAIDALNSKYSHATAPTVVPAGSRVTIPGFAAGVSNFGGGLAYVHADELVSMPRGSSVHTKRETATMLNDPRHLKMLEKIERRLASLEQHAENAPALTGQAVGAASVDGYRTAGVAAAKQNRRAARSKGAF